jgi:hypothetical protein
MRRPGLDASFFPYLIAKADTPIDLIKHVAELRKTAEVKDYRKWLRKVLWDWKDGKVSLQKIRTFGQCRRP